MKSNFAVTLLSLAVLVAACTSSPVTTTSSAPDGSGPPLTGTTQPASPPGGDQPSDVPDDVIPALPLLAAATEMVEPGSTVEITADSRLSGEVFLVGPATDLSSATLEAGSAALAVPEGTSPGRYGLRLNDGSAWGFLTVIDSPGLMIRGAAYVGSDDAPEIEAFVHGVDGGMVVAVELQSGDGSVQRLVPHPLLGLAPVPATSTVQGLAEGRHNLTLPAGFAGNVRLVAGDSETLSDPYAEEEPTLSSAELRISACDETNGIRGDLGAGGVVTVRSAGTAPVARVQTNDGVFHIDVTPGWNLVSATRQDGTSPPPQLIKVGCGSTVEVGDLEQQVESGPDAGEYLGGLTSDDLWAYTATATGDLSFEQESFADCAVSDGALEVTFGSSTADPWLYELTVGPPVDTGVYEGSVHLDDIFTSESADGTLQGEIEVGRIDGLDAIGGAFAGTIEGSLGTIDLDIQFTCAVFSLTGALPVLPAMATSGGLLSAPIHVAPGAIQVGGGIRSGEECQKLFINSQGGEDVGNIELLMGYWATMLMPELPRLGIITADDIRAMIDLEAARQLFGSDEDLSIDIAGALGSEFLLALDNVQAGESWIFTATLYDIEKGRRLADLESTGQSAGAAAQAALDRWTEMVEPLAKAGICAEFDPESAVVDVGATQEFSIEVTNLAGEPPESPEVLEFSSSCGTWDPESGAIDGDTWRTNFTAGDEACEERISATVRSDGTVGEVKTEAEVSIQVEALWQFATTLTFDDGRDRVTAESSGEFFVDSDFDALIGAGTGSAEGGGDAYCEVNGDVTWIPTTLVANYQVMIAGEVTERPDNGPWTVRFAPMGFGISSQITYETSSPCYEAGTYNNDLLGSMAIGLLVGMPHWLANQPDGFLTYMNTSGNEVAFEETLTGLPGATIRGRIWKPQP